MHLDFKIKSWFKIKVFFYKNLFFNILTYSMIVYDVYFYILAILIILLNKIVYTLNYTKKFGLVYRNISKQYVV